VLEAAGVVHEQVQFLLAGVAEGGVPQVVGQSHGLHQVDVQPQRRGDAPRDLAHLEGVGEPRPVEVAFGDDEDLRLMLQPPEGGGVQDAVPVALEFGPVGIGALMVAPRRGRAAHRVGGQRLRFDRLAPGAVGRHRLGEPLDFSLRAGASPVVVY